MHACILAVPHFWFSPVQLIIKPPNTLCTVGDFAQHPSLYCYRFTDCSCIYYPCGKHGSVQKQYLKSDSRALNMNWSLFHTCSLFLSLLVLRYLCDYMAHLSRPCELLRNMKQNWFTISRLYIKHIETKVIEKLAERL